MRRTTMTMGLGLALTLGAAAVASGQTVQPDTARAGAAELRRDRGDRGVRMGERQRRQGRHGAPGAMLLRNITLTEDQKTRLEALRRAQATQTKETRARFQATMREAREARQRGDTVAARTAMEQVRTQMTRLRDENVASLRSILTPDQQRQFDANVAAWKERAERRKTDGARGPRGKRRGPAPAGQPRG